MTGVQMFDGSLQFVSVHDRLRPSVQAVCPDRVHNDGQNTQAQATRETRMSNESRSGDIRVERDRVSLWDNALRLALTSCIALLRAVNLGGHNKIGMADLRDLVTELGKDAQTLLQSGNVVFRSDARPDQLEQRLERAARKELGLETDFFVRTAAEWRGLIAANPFRNEAKADPSHLLAIVLKGEPTARQVRALQQAITGREIVAAKGRCAYIVYPDGIGRSKVTSALIEKALGTRGTARNWNTVLKLGALADAAVD